MNEQEAAAWEIHEFFQSLGLPHAVIGGLENFIPRRQRTRTRLLYYRINFLTFMKAPRCACRSRRPHRDGSPTNHRPARPLKRHEPIPAARAQARLAYSSKQAHALLEQTVL